MSELPRLRDDFDERNTALFLFLGLLSATGKLVRAVEAARPVHGAAPAPRRGPLPRLDALVLGVVSIHRSVRRLADAAAAGPARAEPDPAPPTPAAPRGLLR